MTKSRKLLVGILSLILLCGTFIAGGFVGFTNGYAYRAYQASVTDAYLTMRALEMLNSNDIGGAKKHLESDLDTKITEHWSGMISKPWSFSLLPQNEDATNKLMAKVVAYRKTAPSNTSEPKVKAAIDTVIKRYEK